MDAGRPQANVQYTSFRPLPAEIDEPEDLIDTLRSQSTINSSLPTPASSATDPPDPVLGIAPPVDITGLQPIMTSFPQVRNLLLTSSVSSIPVSRDAGEPTTIFPVSSPARENVGPVPSSVDNISPNSESSPTVTGTPGINIPVAAVNLPNLAPVAVPSASQSSTTEIVIKVTEHKCTVGRCQGRIYGSDQFSFEVCPECDPDPSKRDPPPSES